MAGKQTAEYRRAWRLRNKAKCARYTAEYRARRKEICKRYNEAHPEEVKARKRAWFDRNPHYLESYYAKNRVRYMVQQARRRAAKAGLPFDITENDMTIPDLCPVLGIPIMLSARGGFNPSSPSLDRIVPALGYVKGNVVVISNRANLLKRDGTPEELMKIALWLASHPQG